MAESIASIYTHAVLAFSRPPFHSFDQQQKSATTSIGLLSASSPTTIQDGINTSLLLPSTQIVVNMTSAEIEAYLQELSDRAAITLLPAILFVGFLMIIGAFGNSLVIYIYATKFGHSSFRTAVLALASYDLVVSCLGMPGEIIHFRYSYNYYNGALCKTVAFTGSMAILASTFTLSVVARDRYRRICRPCDKQMTAGDAKMRVLICLFVAAVFSVPGAFAYGIFKQPTDIEGVYGDECFYDVDNRKFNVKRLNDIAHAISIGVVSVIIIAHYILIGRAVFRQKSFRQSLRRGSTREVTADQIEKSEAQLQSSDVCSCQDTNDKILRFASEDGGDAKSIEDSLSKEQNGALNGLDSKVPELTTKAKRKMSTILIDKIKLAYRRSSRPSDEDIRTRKTTLMLFIITVVFLASFLPFIIMKSFKVTKQDFRKTSSTSTILLYSVFSRFFFVNSSVNCFIYGFCSIKFRRECKLAFKKLLCCYKDK